ncbi:protein amalgam-like [Nematostella vectensis]|uniref:protein amalgam-like n=1 Tax=Nematostella vectensis TaxID=45351 RepID=UPI0020770BE8|nr:protein amalgam-like [Nematostella vectensis]
MARNKNRDNTVQIQGEYSDASAITSWTVPSSFLIGIGHFIEVHKKSNEILSDVSGSISIETYVGEDARFSWWSLNPSTSYFVGFSFERGSSTLCEWRTNLTITCLGNVTGPFMSKLFFYGSPASNITFEIKNVKLDNEGPYKVTIYENVNPTTAIERSGVLTVLEAPAFTSSPKSTYDIAENDDVTVTCSASGRPYPNVTWVNKTSGSAVAHRTGSATLSLLKIQRHQAGVYQCQAINDVRRGAITQDVTINVQYPAFIDKTNSSSERTGGWVGYDVSLICVTGGYPTPTVTWSNATGHVLHKEVNLTSKYVFKVKDGDFGNYTCKATNKMGGNDSLVINLYKSENTPPPTMTAPGPPTNAPRTSGTHPGVIAGAVIACVLAVAVVIVALIVWRRKKRPGSSGPKTRSQPNHYDTEGQEQYAIPDRPSAHDQRSSAADELPQYAQVNKEAKKKKPPPGGLIYAELDHTDYPDSRETLTRPSREPQQETDYAVVVGGMRQDPEPQYGNLASEGYNMASEV